MATLEGKTVLIIGGSSGIGFSVAKGALLSLAAKVIIASSNKDRVGEALEKLRAATANKGLPGQISGAILDAKDLRAFEAFFNDIGEIDHLVWTSGDKIKSGFKDIDIEEHKDIFDVRFWGPAVAAQKAQIKTGGSITLSTGQAFIRPQPNWSLLVGLAGAIDSMTRGLALDLAPTRVNTISPGLVRTELFNGTPKDVLDQIFSVGERLPVRHIAEPDEVAEAYLFAMKCTYLTGQTIGVDGGHVLI